MISLINNNRDFGAYINSYHEVHEEHKVKNQKNFALIFVRLRVLCGDWENPNSSEKNTGAQLIHPLSYCNLQ
jgi:hypothetical protein